MSLRIVDIGGDPGDPSLFTDNNGAVWKIQITGGAFVAFLDPSSPIGYLQVFKWIVDEERQNGDGKPYKIIDWTIQEDMPSIAGSLAKIQPREAINAFSSLAKSNIRIRKEVPVSVQVNRTTDALGVIV